MTLKRTLLLMLIFVGTAQLASGQEQRVFPYILKHVWFEPQPTRHPDVHDAVVELETPLSANAKRSVAVIAYNYPKDRRISFEFAWEQPPQVLKMIEGSNSQLYSVSLEVRRGIGAEFVDESASIHVGSGGHSVDVSTGKVAKRLRVERITPETFAENVDVGFREANKRTGVQEGAGQFRLSGAGTNYIKNGALTADMQYAYIRISFEARGSRGTAYYVYENAAAGTGGDAKPPSDDVVTFPDSEEESIPGSSAGQAVVTVDFERGLVAPFGTGQYANGKQIWWNRGNCKSTATADRSFAHSGERALHIVNESPRGPNVFGTTQQPLTQQPGKRYRITAFGRANELRSNGAVSIVVDAAWKIRPIQLPQGTYGWTEFTGTFVADKAGAQLRILSEDTGEAWLDDIRITEE